MKNEFIYFPSISSKISKFYFINERENQYYNDVQLNYPYALISYGNAKQFDTLRSDLCLNEGVVFGDNGGFQINEDTLKEVDLMHLINWLNNNSDIYPILDLPLTKFSFNDSIQFNIKNKEFFLQNKQRDKILLNVIHANNNFRTFKKYFRAVRDESFDGYAIGTIKKKKLYKKAIKYIIKNSPCNIKLIHFFGISNISHYMVLKKLSKKFKITISTDSGLPFILAEKRIKIDKTGKSFIDIKNTKESIAFSNLHVIFDLIKYENSLIHKKRKASKDKS